MNRLAEKLGRREEPGSLPPMSVLVVALLVLGVAWLSAVDSPLVIAFPVLVLAVLLLTRSRDPALSLACLGLVTLSWDRVSVEIGPMTLKPTYVAFGLAFLVEVILGGAQFAHVKASPASRRRLALLRLTVVGVLALYALATLWSGFVADGSRQLFVMAVGAVIPVWVLYRVGLSPARRQTALEWTLIGAAAAAAVGVYQFASTYLPIPSFLSYEGRVGGLGRTAGLSYEPAYFAMYLLSVVPLALGLFSRTESGASRRLHRCHGLILALLLFGILLSNARAGYVGLALVVLVALLGPRIRGLVPFGSRARLVGLIAVVFMAVAALSVVLHFDAYGFARARIESISDRNEPTSNAPRLRLYRVEQRIVANHPWTGIGPGALGHKLPGYGLPLWRYQGAASPGNAPPVWRVVANNIWFQSLLDVGPLGLVGTVLILLGVYRLARWCEDEEGRLLALGCLVVLGVGGLVTSILWDVKIWALIGLALAADAAPGVGARLASQAGAGATAGAVEPS